MTEFFPKVTNSTMWSSGHQTLIAMSEVFLSLFLSEEEEEKEEEEEEGKEGMEEVEKEGLRRSCLIVPMDHEL